MLEALEIISSQSLGHVRNQCCFVCCLLKILAKDFLFLHSNCSWIWKCYCHWHFISIFSVNFPLLNIQIKLSVVVFSSFFWHPLFDTLNYFGLTMIRRNIKKILLFSFKHSKGRSVVISLEVLGKYEMF